MLLILITGLVLQFFYDKRYLIGYSQVCIVFFGLFLSYLGYIYGEKARVKNSNKESIRIQCPECLNPIPITTSKKSYGTRRRNCFECYTHIVYDIDSNLIVHSVKKTPIDFERSSFIKDRVKRNGKEIDVFKAICPNCYYKTRVHQEVNLKDEILFECEHCHRLMRIIS